MKLPPAFHLPGFVERALTQAIDGTPLAVPQLDASEVQQVATRLRDAAQALRAQSLDARVQRVAAACEQLRRRGAGRWRDALAASAGLSLLGFEAAWDATFAPFSVDALRAALQAESLDDDVLVEHDARVPQQILHVMAGNVLAPAMQMLTRGWLLGAAQWLRPAAREPLFAACVMSDLESVDEDLAASTAVLWWPHRSRTEAEIVRRSDAITIQGDDSSVAALQRRVEEIHPRARFVGYGSRWSAALLSREAQTAPNARALAYDVALFDQQGCLSPSIAFVEGSARVEGWCEELAAAFSDLETQLPRGPLTAQARAGLRHWHETTRLKRLLGSVDGLWEDSILWAVALTTDCTSIDSPLDRHLIVVPFEDVGQLCTTMASKFERLQGLAIALEGWDDATRRRALQGFNPSRVAALGTLQLPTPTWCQDHKPPLGSLLAQVEQT